MFKFIIAIVAIATLFTVSGASPTPVQSLEKRRPVGFNITSILFKGKGCPAKTLGVTMSNDLANLTFLYSNMYGTGGPGVNNAIREKGCQISLKIDLPIGYSFGIETVYYRGWYRLDANVRAVHSSAYSFEGYSYHIAAARSVFEGPLSGSYYTARNNYSLIENIRSPCGSASVNQTTFYAANGIWVDTGSNANGWGFVGNQNLSSQLNQVLGFTWYEC